MSDAASRREGKSAPDRGHTLPGAVPGILTYVFALLAIGIGVLVGPEMAGTSLQMENPDRATSLLPILIGVTIGTLAILLVVRLHAGEVLLRVLFVGIFAYLPAIAVSTVIDQSMGIVVGVGTFVILWIHPEWYVLNLAGMAYVGVANAILGVSLVPGLIIAMLVGMALYDAYSVYISEHMQSLVEGASVMDIPMAFVVPRRLSFSLQDSDSLLDIEEDVSLLGYGDAFFPGILAVSAGHFVDAPSLVSGVSLLNAPAIGTLLGAIGGMVGIHILQHFLPRSHPALIVLNPAVVLGFIGGVLVAGVPIISALGL